MSDGFVLESQIRLPYRYATGRWYGAFLLGLSEGRLVASRCAACETVVVPARGHCPACSAASAGLVEVGPEGTALSAVQDHRAGGRAWLLVRPDGASNTLLAHGQASPGSRVMAEFDPAAGPAIAALRFRPLA